MPYTGLFEMRVPADLVKKLAHDLERMERSPLDQFAAFDFFNTADSIVDWLHPDRKSFKDNRTAREKLRKSDVLLRVASHLANGSKHFHAMAHRSVTGTEKFRYADKGYVEPGYCHEPLLIHLTPDEARKLHSPTTVVEAIALASQILGFWIKNIPAS